MNAPDWLVPIVVSKHAMMRARQRLDKQVLDQCEDIAACIRAQVRVGLLLNRVTDIMPEWVNTEKPAAGQLYVRDRRDEWCWVIAKSRDTQGIVVMTVLRRMGRHEDSYRLRLGKVRA